MIDGPTPAPWKKEGEIISLCEWEKGDDSPSFKKISYNVPPLIWLGSMTDDKQSAERLG